MTPITEYELKTNQSERSIKVASEINEFVQTDCEMAYVWFDENVTIGRNVDIYKRALRQLRIFDIKVVQKNKKVVLIKNAKQKMKGGAE